MYYWMKRVKRNKNIFDFHARSVKEFSACHSFLNLIIDAHILAAIGAELEALDWEDLCTKLGECNWRKLIISIMEKYEDPTLICSQRLESNEKRDYVYENAVLLLQHGLQYRRFSHAMTVGDSGWVKLCLKYFCIWLQNNDKRIGHVNYRQESMQFIANFSNIWSSKFTRGWMDNCLVNLSGSPTGWMPADRCGEYVVREIKDRMPDNINTATESYIKHIIGPQAIPLKTSRENIARDVGAVEQYQHSSEVDSTIDLHTILRSLLAEKIFCKIDGRKGYSNRPDRFITSSIDLFGGGYIELCRGASLEILKEKMQKKTENEEEFAQEENEDDNDDDDAD